MINISKGKNDDWMKRRKYLNQYYLIENKRFNKFISFEELMHSKSIFNQIKSGKLEQPMR